jgi:DNA-binding transcriptional ArsR family regulator
MKTCAVCSNPNRTEIDRLLVEKVSLRDIAGRIGVSRSALSRHAGHIPGALVAAKEAGKVADAGTLLDQVKGLVVRATGILDRAEQAGEHQAALGAIREVRGCLELLGKLNGELRTSASAIAIANAQTAPVRTLNDFYADLRGMKEIRAALYGESSE